MGKDGYVMPRSTLKINKTEIINECLEPQRFWDEWHDPRDGFRGIDDRKSIRSNNAMYLKNWANIVRWNKKNKLLLKRRKSKKYKIKEKNKKHLIIKPSQKSRFDKNNFFTRIVQRIT